MTLVDDWEHLMLVAPTNIAFGGEDMKTLLIANLCGWNLATAPMETAGPPVKYPKLSGRDFSRPPNNASASRFLGGLQ